MKFGRSYLAALSGALVVTGCSFHYQNLSGGSARPYQYAMYGKPAIGRYLCMGVRPGTPVYAHARGVSTLGSNPIIGYTRNFVAIEGEQIGRWVMVVHYNHLLGWVDGTKLSLFSQMHPGQICIIPGVDIEQRPIFVIR